jgi:uncharacterized membrane protein YtjA (UPF0391 family)
MDLLTLAIIALVISLIAGVFGFTGIASGAATVAQLDFIHSRGIAQGLGQALQ